MSTYMANPQNVERTWYVIDAEGQVLGRLASQVASMLRGKHKPTFTPHVDCGDYIIVVNCDKLVLTGRMLPKGPLGYAMLKKLHAYAGPEHTHQAQKPVEYKL